MKGWHFVVTKFILQVFLTKLLTMKLGGAGGGPPDNNDPNNYNRQMAELLLREKQAKKRQVSIYSKRLKIVVLSTILFQFFFSGRC